MFNPVVTQRVNAGTELEFGALARDSLGHPAPIDLGAWMLPTRRESGPFARD
jgi:hypothetical protein